MLLPALLSSFLLNVTSSFEMLAIPLIFGQPAKLLFMTTYIYAKAFGGFEPNQGLVGASALVLLLIVFALVFLQNRLLANTRKYTSVSGKASRPRPIALGFLRWPACLLVAVYLLVFVVLPTGALVLRSFVSFLTPMVPIRSVLTLRAYANVLAYPENLQSVTNTVLLAVVGGAAATLLSALVVVVIHRSANPFRRGLSYVAMIPRAVPGMIAGIGFLYSLMVLPFSGVWRGSLVLLFLAYTARHLPTAVGAIVPSIHQLGPDLDRSARVMGANWWQSVRAVVLPVLRPAILSGFVLTVGLFSKEYATAVFLVVPGTEVLGVSILRAWAQGDAGLMSALATIQIALVASFVLVVQRLFGVRTHG